MKFGTGALGVTPAHSLIDEKMAQKNDLETVSVINEKGEIINSGEYSGLNVYKARKLIVECLEEKELLEKVEEIDNNLSICSRCNTPIEPLPSKQWFLKMKELAKPAIKAVIDDKIKFHPKRWEKVYLDWLENIEDWCISRQLWWGHKIPIKNSEDVLDTWFSSALWPFATLGWPKKTEKLDYFYPTNVLSTARDIIFLWVARMVFSSLEFTGKIPFNEVYIHPTVFNKEGKRMSKSLGTGVDPIELIETYGADATRFGLMYQNTGIQDIKFSEEAIFAGKKFANKIWNASRFVMMQVGDSKLKNPNSEIKNPKLKEVVKNYNLDLEKFKFGKLTHELYEYFWHEYCDKTIEEKKKVINSEAASEKEKTDAKGELLNELIALLKLLHPIMPFVTEAVWQELKNIVNDLEDSIMIAKWPEAK